MEKDGCLILIAGPMFSKKSSHLIMRVKEEIIRGKTYQAFKPSLDDRYGQNIVSHDGLSLPAVTVPSVEKMLPLISEDIDVVCIDEIQFYESEVIDVCRRLANSGKIIIVSGLIKDFRDEYFPFKDKTQNMSHLIQAADEIKFLKAICNFKVDSNHICGKQATRTQRFINGDVAPSDSPTVVVGGKDAYAPRCRQHYHFYE